MSFASLVFLPSKQIVETMNFFYLLFFLHFVSAGRKTFFFRRIKFNVVVNRSSSIDIFASHWQIILFIINRNENFRWNILEKKSKKFIETGKNSFEINKAWWHGSYVNHQFAGIWSGIKLYGKLDMEELWGNFFFDGSMEKFLKVQENWN